MTRSRRGVLGRTTERLASWWGRLDTGFRRAVFGPEWSGVQPHQPVVQVAYPGGCVLCPLPLGHPRHGDAGRLLAELREAGGLPVENGQRPEKTLHRRRSAPRRAGGDLPTEMGWR